MTNNPKNVIDIVEVLGEYKYQRTIMSENSVLVEIHHIATNECCGYITDIKFRDVFYNEPYYPTMKICGLKVEASSGWSFSCNMHKITVLYNGAKIIYTAMYHDELKMIIVTIPNNSSDEETCV